MRSRAGIEEHNGASAWDRVPSTSRRPGTGAREPQVRCCRSLPSMELHVSIDDLLYHSLDAGLSWLSEGVATRVLVVGRPEPAQVSALEALDADVRETELPFWVKELRLGVYGVHRRGALEALVVVSDALPEGPSTSARHRFTDDGDRRHLAAARDVLLENWEDARPLLGSSGFAVDDVVAVIGTIKIGRVRRVVRGTAGYRVEVVVDGEITSYSEDSLRRIDGDPRDPEFWVRQPASDAQSIALTLTWTKLQKPLSDTLYSYAASKTIFRAYQFIPALKILNSSSGRLLIADEVGLGKTIEAGIVWSELEQRHELRRTLVVVPSSLTLKWQIEMNRRFDRRLDRIKPPRLAEFAEDLRAGNDPELHAIISLESLRAATEVLEALNSIRPRFDLVIVDEAHALRNVGRRSHVLGGLLSDWADHLLFLSATPINLRSEDLYNVLRLLDEGLFPDMEVFQKQLEPNAHLNAVAREIARGVSGREVKRHLDKVRTDAFGQTVAARPDFRRLEALLETSGSLEHAQRAEVKRLVAELNTLSGVLSRTRKVDVPDAKAVREPHAVDVQWTAAEKDFYDAVFAHFMAKAMDSGVPPGFAMQMPLRQAASCLPAMQRQLRNRNPGLFESEIEDFDEDPSDVDLDALAAVPVLARPLGRDSKLAALRAQLVQLREQGVRQAMIFSTFRGTIAYLTEQLQDEFSVRAMHGGIPVEERQPIIDDFRKGKFDILIVSEVGSEGLDFEFCSVLVNYDLPWNPMRVEQRIGRLDRFGQKNEKIFILNMHMPGTIETDILERLYMRIDIFRNSIGDLEPILRDEFRDITRQILDPRLDADQRRRRADEIATAVETKARQLKELEDARATLSTIDQLQVDGMTDSGPVDGRYVGAAEVRMLVGTLVRSTGAVLSAPDGEGVHTLRGTQQLGDLLWNMRRQEKGSKYPIATLQARLVNGDPIEVTFDAELASRRDVELLSVRHPLVGLAVRQLAADSLNLRRFGRVAVPGLPTRQRYAVEIDLVETTGVRPSRELWATAVDIGTRALADDAGPAILTALAEGTLGDAQPVGDDAVRSLLPRVKDAAWSRRNAEERERRADNDALVEARLQSGRHSLQLKIDRVTATLEQVRRDERDPRVIRLHEGRLRNLREATAELEATATAQRELSMSLTTIAILDVVGD